MKSRNTNSAAAPHEYDKESNATRSESHPETSDGGQTPGSFQETLGVIKGAPRRHEQDLAEIMVELQCLQERCTELEEQNSLLTTLHVACQGLHCATGRDEVLQSVREIIANLIGCEQYALFSLGKDGRLRMLDSFGLAPGRFANLAPGTGHIGRAVQTGDAYISGFDNANDNAKEEGDLTACIPFKLNGVVTGAIALLGLLPQKSGLQELDRELFKLLETHLAIALCRAETREYLNAKTGVEA